MPRRENKIYEFGPFRLIACERLLLHEGHPVRLRPKVFDTLCFLVQHHGHLVGKEEILSSVWPNSVVEENNLAHNVAMIRKALGEAATGQKYVETVPGQGYRFVKEVTESEAEAKGAAEPAVYAPPPDGHVPEVLEPVGPSPATNSGPSWPNLRARSLLLAVLALCIGTAVIFAVRGQKDLTPLDRVDSIAVLPFVAISQDPAVERFSDGLTAELTARLAAIPGVRVPSRTSMSQYKNQAIDVTEVGQAVNAQTLLEGSVRRQGDRFLITAHLIDARDGYHLWSETYDRVSSDALDIQREIAAQISDALRAQVAGKP